MSTTKSFHLGDILSITTDRLVSPRGMEGVYDILNHMTGENLMTHQLPRAADACKAPLLKQHPQLEAIDASSVTSSNYTLWLDEQVAEYGSSLPVESLPDGIYDHMDPMEELFGMLRPDQEVVVVVVEHSCDEHAQEMAYEALGTTQDQEASRE